MGIRFLHTSDWQLGMTRAYLPAESQARYADDQIDGIRRLAQIAMETQCAFVVVAGDIFESIQPERRVVSRAIDALGDFMVPVYLLPGNHDADSPAALWSTSNILSSLPENINLLRDNAVVPVPAVAAEVVGAPWPSRRPEGDLLSAALDKLDVVPEGVVRIVVGHGQVDTLEPDRDNPVVISEARLEGALRDNVATYFALGDRHSATTIGDSGAVRYSGAALATRYTETDPNKALVVEIDPVTKKVVVNEVVVGSWRFVVKNFDVNGPESLTEIQEFLDALEHKERTVVKVGFVGVVNLATYSALQHLLDRSRDLLGALEESERRSELVVLADDADVADLGLSGFAAEALEELVEESRGVGPQAELSGDALVLLHRLAVRTP